MQQEDFKRIQKSIGKVPPQELGRMLREYHRKYFESQRVEPYSEALKIFDGGIL